MDYKSEYKKLNKSWHSEDSEFKAKLVVDILKTINLHPNKFGDLGCGKGHVLAYLSRLFKNGEQFHGLDITVNLHEYWTGH